jgi:predicted unusual protein kinase regulating ubiquinone biosynthesis (AarF/ABC1/UbiB family)
VLGGVRLGLLDFGAVKRLPAELIQAYGAIVMALLQRDARQVASRLEALGFAARGDDPLALARYAELILEGTQTDGAPLDPREVFDRALRLVREQPLARVPQDFVLLGRALGALGGLILQYGAAPEVLPWIVASAFGPAGSLVVGG